MTASEVRDRLDHRFRLLVGSRRGLERHHTLRHAVAWSYDLLDDAEKTLLERCSVFAGGFDLQSACAVAGSDASTTTPSWICSTRWCASRCWSPTGHRGGPGFRCWRRSASSPRNNSSPRGEADRGPDRPCPLLRRARSRHPGPVGQPPTTGGVRLVHRRVGQPAHRVSVGRRPRRPRRRRHHRHLCGVPRAFWVENYEPIAWAEEAHRARPRRRPSPARGPVRDGVAVLHGRTDRGGRPLQRRRPDGSRQWRDEVPFGFEGLLGGAYVASASPNGGSSGAAPSSHAVATLTRSPGHAWSSH